jgi:hypothetical protein
MSNFNPVTKLPFSRFSFSETHRILEIVTHRAPFVGLRLLLPPGGFRGFRVRGVHIEPEDVLAGGGTRADEGEGSRVRGEGALRSKG